MFKIRKMVSISVAMVMICALSLAASAASVATQNDKAFCVGVQYNDTSEGKTGDFTGNALTAKSYYNTINTVNAYCYVKPTKARLDSNITNSIVFLNSHAASDKIKFVYDNGGTSIKCGVKAENGSQNYIGLNDYTMTNVKLISFVGCQTGKGESNLTKSAVSKGASCALGFKNTINSRRSDGKKWLDSYNKYLSQGQTVTYAVSHATVDASSSTLGTYAVIEGSGSTVITPTSTKSNKTNIISKINIPVNFEASKDLTITEKSISELTNQLSKLISDFDSHSYRIEQNMFLASTKTGIVKYNYFIKDTIKTNKSYIIYIEDGIAKEIFYSLLDMNDNEKGVNEAMLLEKVSNFQKPESIIKSYKGSSTNILDNYFEYIYDYKTNELSYCESAFYFDDDDEVIIDDFNEVLIK